MLKYSININANRVIYIFTPNLKAGVMVADFPNEQVCIEFLEELRWNGIIISPFAPNSKIYRCSNSRYKCYDTGKYFTVKTNTLFHNTRIPLQIWFKAILIFEKGTVTSVSLANQLGLTQKSAWTMLRKLKKYFKSEIQNNSSVQKLRISKNDDRLNMLEWLNTIQ